jgi:hypothetical protein
MMAVPSERSDAGFFDDLQVIGIRRSFSVSEVMAA